MILRLSVYELAGCVVAGRKQAVVGEKETLALLLEKPAIDRRITEDRKRVPKGDI